jgi:hypothetical protein
MDDRVGDWRLRIAVLVCRLLGRGPNLRRSIQLSIRVIRIELMGLGPKLMVGLRQAMLLRS